MNAKWLFALVVATVPVVATYAQPKPRGYPNQLVYFDPVAAREADSAAVAQADRAQPQTGHYTGTYMDVRFAAFGSDTLHTDEFKRRWVDANPSLAGCRILITVGPSGRAIEAYRFPRNECAATNAVMAEVARRVRARVFQECCRISFPMRFPRVER